MIAAVKAALAEADVAGLTLDELVERTQMPAAVLRNSLALGCFRDGEVTCHVEPYQKGATAPPGRYRLGYPGPLLKAQ